MQERQGQPLPEGLYISDVAYNPAWVSKCEGHSGFLFGFTQTIIHWSFIMNVTSLGFLSLHQIIGDPRKNIPPIIPVCRSTWWSGIKSGRYPKGIKISPRRTAWRVQDIQALLNSLS